MQLCPTAATTLRGDPCLPSRACKYLSGLTGSACRAWGEAASALHAMALLQVHQAKALKDLHEGGHDLAVLHELRAATDLVLRATKVTALVVQERHLWLCLADMKEQEKVQFLGAPVSQTGLFGDAVESFAQQFSAAQKQTEAIKHIMCRRKPAASTLAAVPQPARRRGRPSAAAPAQPQQPSTRQRRGAGRRQDTQPVQAPAKHGGKRKCKRPWDGRPKMLTQKRIFGCVRPLDWFAAIDLKDVYFHVSILPWHRPFLRFTFEGRAYQYKVLPYRLFLSPCVFTKVTEAALVPLRERGVRILNYLDDWFILAQSREQLCAHRDLVLRHLSQLGLRVNWEKSKLVPTQRISFLGTELDSVNQTACLTQERAQSVLNCLKTLSGRTAVPLKFFQRLLGHMASAAAIGSWGIWLQLRP